MLTLFSNEFRLSMEHISQNKWSLFWGYNKFVTIGYVCILRQMRILWLIGACHTAVRLPLNSVCEHCLVNFPVSLVSILTTYIKPIFTQQLWAYESSVLLIYHNRYNEYFQFPDKTLKLHTCDNFVKMSTWCI